MVAEGGGKWTWHGHGSPGSNRRVSRALDLSFLSLAEKDALILAQAEQLSAQAAQIAALLAQIAALEAKLGQPPKTPRQLVAAAVAGREAEPEGAAGQAAAEPSRRGAGAGGGSGSRGGGLCRELPALCPRAEPSRPARDGDARSHRTAADPAGDHPRAPSSRPLPGLPGTVLCAAAAGIGSWLAVRPWVVRAGRPPARHPGDRL